MLQKHTLLLTGLLAALATATTAVARSDVAPVDNALYADECGACHYAYPPGLLPARSWEKLMAQLSDHFGENAELNAEDLKTLTAYAVNKAADKSNYEKSKKIARSIKANDTPLRISETAYIRDKHHEIPRRMLQDNPQVKSLSKCNACHTNAAKGVFEEDEVKIPGFGRWED